MPALHLTPADRRRLRAEAHALDPIVRVGNDGASASVRRELDAALKAHGLVKVRVFEDARAARETLFAELADALSAAPVQHIGKLLVFWRTPEPKQKTLREDRGAGPKVVKVLKFSKSGNHRPQVKRVTVTGNMRMTQGGELKRARKRPANSKKRSLST